MRGPLCHRPRCDAKLGRGPAGCALRSYRRPPPPLEDPEDPERGQGRQPQYRGQPQGGGPAAPIDEVAGQAGDQTHARVVERVEEPEPGAPAPRREHLPREATTPATGAIRRPTRALQSTAGPPAPMPRTRPHIQRGPPRSPRHAVGLGPGARSRRARQRSLELEAHGGPRDHREREDRPAVSDGHRPRYIGGPLGRTGPPERLAAGCAPRPADLRPWAGRQSHVRANAVTLAGPDACEGPSR